MNQPAVIRAGVFRAPQNTPPARSDRLGPIPNNPDVNREELTPFPDVNREELTPFPFKVKDKILFYLSSIEQDPKAEFPLNLPIPALHAFDLSSRAPMWEFQLGHWQGASVERVTENAVYVIASNRGDHSTAFCIDKKTGKIFWRNEAASAVEGTSRFMVTE